jgi:50S ribosomal subunit-associated GTPase HflX
MRIETRVEQGILVVDVPDPLLEAESPQSVRNSLATAFGAGEQPVVVVLRKVGKITSDKLGLLVGAISQALKSCPDRMFVFVSEDEAFASLFDVPSEQHFRHFGTTDEAIDYLRGKFKP